jgi:hypothetical protein
MQSLFPPNTLANKGAAPSANQRYCFKTGGTTHSNGMGYKCCCAAIMNPTAGDNVNTEEDEFTK